MLTKEQLAEIEQRAEKATPGPWEYDGMAYVWTDGFYIFETRGFGYFTTHGMTKDEAEKQMDSNSIFCSHAREDIPALLSHIRELEAQLKLEHGGALAAAENCLRLQGEVNDLQAQLAKEKRRAEKAVEDLAFACGSQPNTSDDCSICDICKYKQNDGSCPKQCFMNSLGASNRWQWRGDAEDGEK